MTKHIHEHPCDREADCVIHHKYRGIERTSKHTSMASFVHEPGELRDSRDGDHSQENTASDNDFVTDFVKDPLGMFREFKF